MESSLSQLRKIVMVLRQSTRTGGFLRNANRATGMFGNFVAATPMSVSQGGQQKN